MYLNQGNCMKLLHSVCSRKLRFKVRMNILSSLAMYHVIGILSSGRSQHISNQPSSTVETIIIIIKEFKFHIIFNIFIIRNCLLYLFFPFFYWTFKTSFRFRNVHLSLIFTILFSSYFQYFWSRITYILTNWEWFHDTIRIFYAHFADHQGSHAGSCSST